MGGDFSAAKGELRKLNVTAGLGGKSYLSYLKVPDEYVVDKDGFTTETIVKHFGFTATIM